VRAPSTVSVMVPLSTAYAADSRMYAGVARRRYHRTMTTMVGTPTNSATDTSGSITRHAATVSVIVTTATITRGTPNRTACCSLLTSLVVRVTRSPVPARSTVDSGNDVTVSRNSSRSSAKTFSPNRMDARCAYRMSPVCVTTAARPTATAVLMYRASVPRVTASTMRPSSSGPARPAIAASVCSTAMPPRGRRWRRSRSAA
jgi:hypothetical protein